MKMSKFQIGLLVVFGAFIVVAVFLFSRNKGGSTAGITLKVWGSMSAYEFNTALAGSGLSANDAVAFDYTEKSPNNLSKEFTEALAEGRGPDLVILSAENIIKDKDKLLLIPAESVKQADFVSTFIKGGEIFLVQNGSLALPLYVDPMVLYWNRDVLAKAALAAPPVYWDQIYDYIKKLTVKDNAGNLTSTALALGESKNIPHSKEILSLLMLQAGTSIVDMVPGLGYRSTFLESNGQAQVPSVAALEFYTQFANPQKSYYTWNRSLLPAETSFTSGKSAMYLGFASELKTLKAKSPTLDIGIAPVPQSRTSGRASTFARIYGVAISRSASNPMGALTGALALVSKSSVKALSNSGSIVPARRDLLSETPGDPAGYVFYAAGLLSRGWLDPDAEKTDKIFTDMIESVTSGRARVDEAVGNANTILNAILEQS